MRASVEPRLRATARTCGDRGCAERRRWRERNDDTWARAAPQRRKKREARTKALQEELVELSDRAGVDAAAELQCCEMLALRRGRRADAVAVMAAGAHVGPHTGMRWPSAGGGGAAEASDAR